MINSLLMLVKISVYIEQRSGYLFIRRSYRSIFARFQIIMLLFIFHLHCYLLHYIIILAKDVELNPDPTSLLNFGHLNVRSLNNQD